MPISSADKPMPRFAIPRVSVISAEVMDFDRCSKVGGCKRVEFIGKTDAWLWTIGSAANFTRDAACC